MREVKNSDKEKKGEIEVNNNTRKILAVLSGLMIVVGSWMVFILPGQMADKEIGKAKGLMAGVQQKSAEVSGQAATLKWFKKKYLEEFSSLLGQIRSDIVQAERELKTAEAAKKSQDKMDHAEASVRFLDDKSGALLAISKAQEKLASFQKMIADARIQLATVQQKTQLLKMEHKKTQANLKTEAPRYLSKYVKAMNSELLNAEKNILQTIGLLADVGDLLPSEKDESSNGDPAEALKLLGEGQEYLKVAEAATQSVEKQIVLQRDAFANADSQVASARQQLEKAKGHLKEVAGSAGLSADKALKDAYQRNNEAAKLLGEAERALITKVENGKRDVVLAYSNALRVIELSQGISQEADKQAQLAKDAGSRINAVRAKLQTTEREVARADSYYDILRRNHNSSVWQGIAGNLDSSRRELNSSRENISKAESLLREQQFPSVVASCNEIHRTLDHAGQLVSQLQSQTEELERYRQEWPDAERRAQSTINDEEDKIDQYGSHDASARSDFNNAEEYLSAARSFATRKDFESAVKKAKEADDLAEGTGDKAYAAYEDEQESQRRRASSDNDDDDSSPGLGGGGFGGSDSGGFGSDSGGFGGSDGGGFGSGSSGSDGGGYGGSSGGSDGGGYD